MSKLIFVIYFPGRKQNIGGHVVLHKLAKILCDLGVEVWVTQKPMFQCNAKIVDTEKINLVRKDRKVDARGYKLVALYPETIKGNPLKIENVVRWILYHPIPDIEKTWDATDEYFYFIKGFNTQRETNNRMLSIIDPKLDIFYNRGLGKERKGYCHINKKKYPAGETLLSELGSRDLSNFMDLGGFEYLATEMNKYEYFVTYDDATFYSIAAAMCGCRSIIINTDTRMTAEEYRNKFGYSMYGVAYGWHDIKHADMTRDIVRDFMKRSEKHSVHNVEQLIKFWEKKLAV
jgi:hypothetical protein